MEAVEIVREVASAVDGPLRTSVALYSHWFFVNALVWIAFGLVFACGGLYTLRRALRTDEDAQAVLCVVGFAMVIIGIFLIAGHMTNLLEPTARGIHELLGDMRGGG